MDTEQPKSSFAYTSARSGEGATAQPSDRELLELAAKAAGAMDVFWCVEYSRMQIGREHKGGTNYEEWNPLTDDGDAFRLMTALNMDVRFGMAPEGPYVYAVCAYGDCEDRNEVAWDGPTADSATRRAIVRAAAFIGSQP
jgi:hypothetical protein